MCARLLPNDAITGIARLTHTGLYLQGLAAEQTQKRLLMNDNWQGMIHVAQFRCLNSIRGQGTKIS